MNSLLRHLLAVRHNLRTLCPLVFALAFALEAGAGADSMKLQRPVMIDSDSSGSKAFVLDGAGMLHEFQVKQGALEEYRAVPLPADLNPSDMTYVLSGDKEALLVAGTQSRRGAVVLYSLDGSLLQTWSLRNICSGIDFGAATHIAYAATSDSNEIYRLDLKATDVAFVTQVDDAGKLGPLAFDEARQEIYVADVAAGRIYKYSIGRKTLSILVTDLSAPTALSFDPDTGRLYVADPGRRGIFTIDTRSAKPPLRQFASGQLQTPYGMALLSQNRVAVADYGANRILVFSNKGSLLFRFPPNQ